MPSIGWVQLSNPIYQKRLAYVVEVYRLGDRFFLALDIYPTTSLCADPTLGELTSSDPRVVASPRVAGGVGVHGRVLEASEDLVKLWPLTKIACERHCEFVVKA